jgi:hypothetical protein
VWGVVKVEKNREMGWALVRSSSNAPPFCLTDAQIVEERSEPQAIVLQRALEGFRLLAKPFDTHQEVLRLAREGQRVGDGPDIVGESSLPRWRHAERLKGTEPKKVPRAECHVYSRSSSIACRGALELDVDDCSQRVVVSSERVNVSTHLLTFAGEWGGWSCLHA